MTSTAPALALGDEALAELARAAELLKGRRIAALTGAGVSTDSGIPDYRGAGAPVRTPMTYSQFLADEPYRKRYWAGSHLGWSRFATSRPNSGHRMLAELEQAGLVTGVVTQNVDGLHVRAGSQRVVDLHGSMDRVVCLHCGQAFSREAVAERISVLNPWFDESAASRVNPDGDAEVDDVSRFAVPECTVCGGTLKPDIVFFGEFVPPVKFEEARSIVARADALVVLGSSLVVNSGVRLVGLAQKRRIPVIIVNRGVTKADARAAVKIDAGTSETLALLRDALLP
ncbi:NAD-dependent SIR2 family protein deacetylase [Microcella putealis]|uniref:protein acetyllysine N-acetyltransferase n=1 Tax=Microcella putealis TaxID=337005 RepID=A0A4Q7LWP2_9MICO|nr:Sir2 family NAD-dependent protein deacetylase [Microcella putealis]RZS58882.1 NAD-dependent SIR2 family protein deacetylase [Microcella putealis]TQM23908.1 NAD-dependent SIR2 family protein deacetylase [Microcella putealis]HET8958151.1 Sir2 family NAD-dependent protein deacetylase [Microcella sp.]